MPTNISELGLQEEEMPDVDWNAPEGGMFAPQVSVGRHTFTFKLSDDPYSTRKIEGKDYLQLTYSASTEVDGVEKTLNYQRVDTYQAEWMKKSNKNASLYELLRALGIRFAGKPTTQQIQDAFNEANAQAKRFEGTVNWRAYDKDSEFEFSTRPSKKKVAAGKQGQWPRDKDGNYEPFVTFPKSGNKGSGREEITDFHLPENGGEVRSSTGGSGGISI